VQILHIRDYQERKNTGQCTSVFCLQDISSTLVAHPTTISSVWYQQPFFKVFTIMLLYTLTSALHTVLRVRYSHPQCRFKPPAIVRNILAGFSSVWQWSYANALITKITDRSCVFIRSFLCFTRSFSSFTTHHKSWTRSHILVL